MPAHMGWLFFGLFGLEGACCIGYSEGLRFALPGEPVPFALPAASAVAGSFFSPAGELLSFASPKEKGERKGDPTSPPQLRWVTCVARIYRGLSPTR